MGRKHNKVAVAVIDEWPEAVAQRFATLDADDIENLVIPLLPCPHCNGKSEVRPYLGKKYVICTKCRIRTDVYSDANAAIIAWNGKRKNAEW